MACKNCVKNDALKWRDAIVFTAMGIGVLAGIAGMIVTAYQSMDSYEWEGWVRPTMNWLQFSIFGGLTLPGIVSVVYANIPWEYVDKEIDC